MERIIRFANQLDHLVQPGDTPMAQDPQDQFVRRQTITENAFPLAERSVRSTAACAVRKLKGLWKLVHGTRCDQGIVIRVMRYQV